MLLLGEEEIENVCHKLSKLCWKELVHDRHQAMKVVEELLNLFNLPITMSKL